MLRILDLPTIARKAADAPREISADAKRMPTLAINSVVVAKFSKPFQPCYYSPAPLSSLPTPCKKYQQTKPPPPPEERDAEPIQILLGH
mmetsp:Transcript_40959/g.74989  ORF Transcript_40959/g.74989 Transcript_40959/m.74989 type:complete len:89 (+) Transcript_40959:122-388(+)